MLKQRLLTAAILIPFIVISILYLPTVVVQWLMVAVVVLAAIEWFTIIGYKGKMKILFAMTVLLFVTVISLMLSTSMLALVALIIWGLMLLLIARYAHQALPARLQRLILQPLSALVITSSVLALFLLTSVQLHQSSDIGPQQLLYVIILVWLADTGGYFAGKKWGKTPLAKAISPNKTWEGVAGALVLGIVWAIVAYSFGLSGSLTIMTWVILSIISVLISIVGDLFESLFKRSHQVKDSGSLLPGHGGMLDRIDSLISAVPVFTASLYFLGA